MEFSAHWRQTRGGAAAAPPPRRGEPIRHGGRLMRSRLGLVLLSLVILSGCTTMKPTDFKNATPQLVIEEYFAGETQAWGLFEDR
ncbi:MAG: DUF3833 family protein, partial [Pseudomonadota bacterium]|nr:DUF3833 family protein [Pseudomonadota bacterium]